MSKTNHHLKELEAQLIEEEYKLAEESLSYFFKRAWRCIEPTEYIPAWHLDVIADHLTAQANGDPSCQRLIINLHPRLGKSLLCSVVYPMWLWLRFPEERIMCASHTQRLVVDFSVKSRTLINNPWFKDYWINKKQIFKLTGDSNTKLRFDNDRYGYRLGVTPGMEILGLGYTTLVCDDLNTSKAIYSASAIQTAIDFYCDVLRNRANNARTAKKLLIQQRLSTRDITAYLLENEPGWTQVTLPAEYEPKLTFISPIGVNDRRTKAGELICPERFTSDYYHTDKKKPVIWEAIYQQNPQDSSGSVINSSLFKYTNKLPDLDKYDRLILSADLAIEEDEDSDYCAFALLGQIGSKIYLVDMVRELLGFPDQLKRFLELCSKYPQARTRLVEKRATGSPLIQMLEGTITGLIPIVPVKSKVERLYACLPEFTAGNIYFPDPEEYPWVQPFLDEILAFPSGEYDDQVDAFSQAVNYMCLNQKGNSSAILPEGNSVAGEVKSMFNASNSQGVAPTISHIKRMFEY